MLLKKPPGLFVRLREMLAVLKSSVAQGSKRPAAFCLPPILSAPAQLRQRLTAHGQRIPRGIGACNSTPVGQVSRPALLSARPEAGAGVQTAELAPARLLPGRTTLTWRTHSCVPCRHSWRHVLLPKMAFESCLAQGPSTPARPPSHKQRSAGLEETCGFLPPPRFSPPPPNSAHGSRPTDTYHHTTLKNISPVSPTT